MRKNPLGSFDVWPTLETGDVLTPHGPIMPPGTSSQEIRDYQALLRSAPKMLAEIRLAVKHLEIGSINQGDIVHFRLTDVLKKAETLNSNGKETT